MQINSMLLLPIVFPFVAGIICGFQKQEKQRNILVVLTLVIELGLVLWMCRGENVFTLWQITEHLSISYHTDGLAKFFVCLICTIWLLAGIFSLEYMKHEQKPERFFMFYIMSLGALVSLCFSANMMTLYLSYEYMTILTLPLVLHTGTVDAVRAAMKYLGYSIFGAGLGLMGFFFLNSYCDTTTFLPGGTLNAFLSGNHHLLMQIVYLLTMIGFGCKAGMFPLHAWLPTAHPVAPSPASAVLSGIITKGGVIAIIRVTFYLVGIDFIRGTWVQHTLLILSMITVFMGSMLAYKEKLLKKRLAYSTVSQVSYVLFGLFLLHPIGFLGALMQVVFHAVAKNILFFGAGAIIYKTGKTFVYEYRGLGKQMPIVMWTFAIASLSLIGIPPTAGFASKWYLAQGGLSPEYGTLGLIGVAVLMVSALLTAGYLLPIVHDAFFPGRDFDYAKLEKKEPNGLMTVPLVVLAAAILLLGMFPQSLMTYITQISSTIF